MKLPYVINKPLEAVSIFLVGASLVASAYFYVQFPAQVPSHYTITGVADRYADKAWVAFGMPALLVIIYFGMVFVPLLDPKKERYREFSKPYQVIRLLLMVYLTALYFVTSLYALGYPINVADASTIGIGILFLVIGNFMPKLKQTWFVGIRTPWTLSDEGVWRDTHRVGGWLFSASGVATLLSVMLPAYYRWWVFMAVIIATVGITFVYSYWRWHKRHT